MLAIGAKYRHFKYGSQHFDTNVLPRCKELLKEIEVVSHPDASKIWDAFVSIDSDGSEKVSCAEFHRYFGWKRGVLTERIFDMYLEQASESNTLLIDKKDGLSFEPFLVCIWNFCSYDKEMMAQYLFNILDIDRTDTISMHECYALMRMIYQNEPRQSCEAAMSIIRDYKKDQESITLDSFVELVGTNDGIIQPAFDIQTRLIERTTTHKKSRWEEYRTKRRLKFGSEELIDVEYDGNIISNSAKILHQRLLRNN